MLITAMSEFAIDSFDKQKKSPSYLQIFRSDAQRCDNVNIPKFHIKIKVKNIDITTQIPWSTRKYRNV